MYVKHPKMRYEHSHARDNVCALRLLSKGRSTWHNVVPARATLNRFVVCVICGGLACHGSHARESFDRDRAPYVAESAIISSFLCLRHFL